MALSLVAVACGDDGDGLPADAAADGAADIAVERGADDGAGERGADAGRDDHPAADAHDGPPRLTDEGPTITPNRGEFGTVLLGAVSETHAFTLRNVGGTPVEVLPAMVTGDFVLARDGCAPLLAGNMACALEVRFAPKMVGPRAGQLIVSTKGGVPGTVTLSGTGVTPARLAVAPPALVFEAPVGMRSAPATVTVTNEGTAQSGSLTTTLTGADFMIVTNRCAALAGLASCTIELVFLSTTAGQKTGALAVSAGARGGAVTVELAATAR